MIKTFEKAPTDVLDYTIDWTSFLNGDVISTSTWTVSTGLTKGSDSKTTTTTTVWISSGTLGQSYEVTNTIITAGGRTKSQCFEVLIATT